MAPERCTVDGDGVRLAVWEQGSGPTVVLVHGYPDTHRVWDGVAADLAADHHVVAYDVRGAGESGEPSGDRGYEMPHLLADLRAVLDAVSPDEPVHLVGHDWGSLQGWAAVTDPSLTSRIASYTSISGPSLDHVSRWVREHRRLEWPAVRRLLRQGVRSWYVGFFQIPALADTAWRTFLPKAIDRYRADVEHVPASARSPETLARDGRNGLELYRQNVPARMREPQLATTDVPVLLLVAKGDRYITTDLLDGLDRIAPDLTREDLDGGHWIVASQPGVVAGSIRRHIRRRAEGSPDLPQV